MRGPKALFEAENNLVTEMGAWFPGERVVFRGKDLHHDLADLSWMELYLFGITGKRFDAGALEVFNAIWVLTSYPDPRLWNNRVTYLASTSRSTGVLGISAGIAISEATVYGARPEIFAYDLIAIAKSECFKENDIWEYLAQTLERWRALPGYGRPITYADERLQPLHRILLNVATEWPHVVMAKTIESVLEKKGYPFKLNYAGLTAAASADLGLTRNEFYLFCSLAFVGGMLPIVCDGAAREAGSYFPRRCAHIETTSSANRSWSKY